MVRLPSHQHWVCGGRPVWYLNSGGRGWEWQAQLLQQALPSGRLWSTPSSTCPLGLVPPGLRSRAFPHGGEHEIFILFFHYPQGWLFLDTHTHQPLQSLSSDSPTSPPAQFSVAASESQFSPWYLIATLRMLGKPLDFSQSPFPSCKMGLLGVLKGC